MPEGVATNEWGVVNNSAVDDGGGNSPKRHDHLTQIGTLNSITTTCTYSFFALFVVERVWDGHRHVSLVFVLWLFVVRFDPFQRLLQQSRSNSKRNRAQIAC
jgi:hypothetical protein